MSGTEVGADPLIAGVSTNKEVGSNNSYGGINEEAPVKTAAEERAEIIKYCQVWKFCFYGFFKNLKFFEAFLVYILMQWGLDLFQIGLLKSVEQLAEYILEVPSGMIADRFGNKSLTMACFLLYIASFMLYAQGGHWVTLVAASVVYGFGQAFRSGSHKAMILIWLDINGYKAHKKFVYGRTRSWSMLGSALSPLIGFVILLYLKRPALLFIIATTPYLIDFFLIASYPKALNVTYQKKNEGFCRSLVQQCKALGSALRDRNMAKILVSTALFNAVHQSLKDYIQPIVVVTIATVMASFGHPLAKDGQEGQTETQLALAVCYCCFYLLSSVASSKAYIFGDMFSNSVVASDLVADIQALALLAVGLCLHFSCPLPIFFLFMFKYVLHSARKPLMLSAIGDVMSKEQRATVLSVESMLKTTIMFFFAPLAGFLVHHYSMQVFFLTCPPVLFFINRCCLAGANTQGGAGV